MLLKNMSSPIDQTPDNEHIEDDNNKEVKRLNATQLMLEKELEASARKDQTIEKLKDDKCSANYLLDLKDREIASLEEKLDQCRMNLNSWVERAQLAEALLFELRQEIKHKDGWRHPIINPQRVDTNSKMTS